MALADLIDKQDTVEIVRDKIALILFEEEANQRALASAAGKDPELWRLKIYSERSNPWEQYFQDDPDPTPIVNVWIDNGTFPGANGDTIERQAGEFIFNVDCYGYAVSQNNPAGGHIAGDRAAALEAQRAMRLCRNILMSSENAYLQLRGTVWQRWPQSITYFQPQRDAQGVQDIVGARLAMRVKFNEFSPQATPETLERVFVDVKRAEDGQIVASADYVYPL